MKKFKNVLKSLVLVICFSCFACGQIHVIKGDELKGYVNAYLAEMKEDGTMDAIMDKYFNGGEITGITSATYNGTGEGQLVVATNAGFAPFEYKIGNMFFGIDMEIAKHIADKMNLQLVIVDMDFDGIVGAVGNTVDGIQIGMAGMTVNEVRKQTGNFTDTYYQASQMIIVKSDDTTFDACTTVEEIENILSASNKKIGYQSGTTGEYYIEGDVDWGFDGYANLNGSGYQNAGLAVNDMKNGNIDWVIIDEMPAKVLANSVSGVKVIEIGLTEEEYAFCVCK